MTPEEARKLLDAATPGPWERHPDSPRALCNLAANFLVHHEPIKSRGLEPEAEDVANTALIAAAPDALALVAGLRVEYAPQYWDEEEGWLQSIWQDSYESAEQALERHVRFTDTRIVARYVTAEPWEVEG